ALLLTLLVLLVEFAGGLLSHSLALLSDAGHVLTDVFALGLAWFPVEQSKRPADRRRSYGYQRVSILAALVNSVTLIVIVIAIAYEAVRRLASPEPVQGWVVVVTALIGIAVNSYVAFGLRGDTKSLNIRAAFLHVAGDMGASVGVVLAGVVILLTGWLYIDPILSLGMAALIAFETWSSGCADALRSGIRRSRSRAAIRAGRSTTAQASTTTRTSTSCLLLGNQRLLALQDPPRHGDSRGVRRVHPAIAEAPGAQR